MAKSKSIIVYKNEYLDDKLKIEIDQFEGGYVLIHGKMGNIEYAHALTRDEAIAAARAILKHFGED